MVPEVVHDYYTILAADGSILWQAQDGPQQDLFDLSLNPNIEAEEILFGGARGGGKTSALRAWMTMYIANPQFKGLILRKTNESLKEFIDTAWELYKPMGAKQTGRPTGFVWPNGARIYTAHFKDERSLEDVKGHEYHLIGLEEATQIEFESMYEALLGSNRSTVRGIKPRILLTTNPDGIGNAWLKRRFINVYQGGVKLEPKTPFRAENKKVRVFIPARIWDNKILMDLDPGYYNTLAGDQNEARRKAWLLGDWDCQDGTFFPEFRPNGPHAGEPAHANHVIPEQSIQAWCHRWASLDWGFAHHAAGYWGALNTDKRTHVYREMVVRAMAADDLGSEFARRTLPDLIGLQDRAITLYLSHDAFAGRNGGKSIAEQVKTGIERTIGPGSCYLLGKTEDERKQAEHDEAGAREMFQERFQEQFKDARIVIKRSSQDRSAAASVAREYFKWRNYVERVEMDGKYAKWLMEQPNGYQRFMEYKAQFDAQQELPPVPRVLIHDCCRVLIETIPQLRPDPNDLEKVRKFHGDKDDIGDDPWDGFSYLLMGAKEQQNALPYAEYMAKEVARHIDPKETDINLRIQVARNFHDKYNQQSGSSVIESLPRDSMRQRWCN